MSKRNSIGSPAAGGNTLFKYFAKSPASATKSKDPIKGGLSVAETTAKNSSQPSTPKTSTKKTENGKQNQIKKNNNYL